MADEQKLSQGIDKGGAAALFLRTGKEEYANHAVKQYFQESGLVDDPRASGAIATYNHASPQARAKAAEIYGGMYEGEVGQFKASDLSEGHFKSVLQGVNPMLKAQVEQILGSHQVPVGEILAKIADANYALHYKGTKLISEDQKKEAAINMQKYGLAERVIRFLMDFDLEERAVPGVLPRAKDAGLEKMLFSA
jgi:hypothetical protein